MAQNEPQHKETPPGPSPNSPSVSGISVYKRQIYEIAESSLIESKLFLPELECSTAPHKAVRLRPRAGAALCSCRPTWYKKAYTPRCKTLAAPC